MTKQREKKKLFEELKELEVRKLEVEAKIARINLEQNKEFIKDKI